MLSQNLLEIALRRSVVFVRLSTLRRFIPNKLPIDLSLGPPHMFNQIYKG